jgi:hypothetical protein
MKSLCVLCSKSAGREDCYVRVDREDRPACRPCWEQLLLDPRRVIREIREGAVRRWFADPSAS